MARRNGTGTRAQQVKAANAQRQQQQSVFALTAGKKYDPETIYSASTDGRGHYEQLRVKITPQVEHLIAEVVNMHDEFRSSNDFVRNAIFHMLHTYLTNPPDVEPRLKQAIAAERQTHALAMDARMLQAHYDLMSSVKGALNDCIETADWQGMQDLVEMVEEQVTGNLPIGLREQYAEVAADGLGSMRNEMKLRKAPRVVSALRDRG